MLTRVASKVANVSEKSPWGPSRGIMHQQMFVRIGGLVLAGGASFLYVKKVLTNRRKRREDIDRLQEQPNDRASQYGSF
ncbi:hypothetical protein JVT61DRAFT_15412 [Boletus reticuloceps]|uniref:Uncharacterized protein n=1 Tax=Boletus reticuloceps TaxID=495285 RepID=A0A8I2YT71_9AGAM|nr:hypothetical protein JVT61DRAFT_15412 [Boletus reticuloceps]